MRLHAVLAPGVLAYDACGLQAAADKPGREGHAVSMMGREDAAGVIKRLHAKFDDSNTLVASAVNPDMRVSGVCACVSCLQRRRDSARTARSAHGVVLTHTHTAHTGCV
jgi:hypothetical protein